jgi:hypothetical protein
MSAALAFKKGCCANVLATAFQDLFLPTIAREVCSIFHPKRPEYI